MIQMPGQAAPTAAPPGALSGATTLPPLLASVTGAAASGATLALSGQATLSLSTARGAALPAGSQLLLDFLAPPQPVQPGGVQAQQPAQVAAFQTLREAIAMLAQGDPAAAQRIAQSLIPSSGPQLAPALLFLVMAMRGGGAPGWLGPDAARAVERTRRGTLGRLDQEMKGAQGRARDSAGGDWRVMTMPVSDQGSLDPIRLYIRDRDRQDAASEEDGRENQRFVVEVNFTRLGPFQFDSLVRGKQVDLMVRTHEPLEESVRNDIRHLFGDTVSALGLGGSVGFHVVAAFDLAPEGGPGDDRKQGVTV